MSRPLIVIVILVAASLAGALLMTEHVQDTSSVFRTEVFLERPDEGYSRTRVDLPFTHTFGREHENIYIDFVTQSPVGRYRAVVTYDSPQPLEIRPFPEKNFTVLERTGSREGSRTYTYTDVMGESNSLVIKARPGVELTLKSVEAVPLGALAPQNDYGFKYRTIFALLVLAFPVYWLLHRSQRWSQWFLVGLSMAALAYLDVHFFGLLLVLLLGFYSLKGVLLSERDAKIRFFYLFLVASLLFLAIFKYVPEIYYNLFFKMGGIPLGLSYFFFRFLHVGIEWARGGHEDINLRKYLLFVLFFPTIPAGPIETIDGFYEKRLDRLNGNTFVQASTRILIGYLKKMVLVDFLMAEILFRGGDGIFVHTLFDPKHVSQGNIWLNLPLLLLYSYLDFSAYSDMAIGTGTLFGYRIKENFKWPLFSRNAGEYWKRYHVSLGEWVQRHVYFPVLMTTRITWLAIFLTFLTIGLWHWLDMNWWAWAVHQSVGVVFIMVLDEALYRYKLGHNKTLLAFRRAWTPLAVGLTLIWMSSAYALVFFHDFNTAMTVYSRFFGV